MPPKDDARADPYTITYSYANEERLFQTTDFSKSGIHSTRSVYACDLYKYFSENGYASGEIYRCRKELSGYIYDKGILNEVSYNLQKRYIHLQEEFLRFL